LDFFVFGCYKKIYYICVLVIYKRITNGKNMSTKMKTLPCEGNNPMSKHYHSEPCGQYLKVADNVVKVICWRCTAKGLPTPTMVGKSNVATGFPRGWKFMKEFVHQNGSVYHKGEEQPSLRGTLEPTPFKTAKPRKVKPTLDDKIQEEYNKKLKTKKSKSKKS
jgi:hypothetical protein